MTEKVLLDLIDHIVPIITALISLAGAIGTAASLIRSNKNAIVMKKVQEDQVVTNVGIAVNSDKSNELEKTVNSRMAEFMEQTRQQNEAMLAEAVRAAELKTKQDAERKLRDLEFQLQLAHEKLKNVAPIVIPPGTVISPIGVKDLPIQVQTAPVDETLKETEADTISLGFKNRRKTDG